MLKALLQATHGINVSQNWRIIDLNDAMLLSSYNQAIS